LGDSAVIGATTNAGITSITINANLIPTDTLTYSIGSTTTRWKDIFIGPGTLDIAGPIGSTAVGTIGTDLAGIVYTQGGFASPTVIVGPRPGATGAVGGWQLRAEGDPGSTYDLIAQQNVNTADGGLTGPSYSLITGVVRSINGDAGITATAGASGTTIALVPTGVAAGTYSAPTMTVNTYGQVTSITDGPANDVYNLNKIVTGNTVTTTPTPITSTATTITNSSSNIVAIANSVVSNVGNGHYFNMYLGITGPGTTAGTAGATSDTTVFQSHDANAWLQNIVMHDYTPPSAGQYYITVYGWVSSGSASVQNSHVLVYGNMVKSP
jgi:hypothetical protein